LGDRAITIKVNGHRKKMGSLLIPLNILIELFGISKLCMSQLQKRLKFNTRRAKFWLCIVSDLSDYHWFVNFNQSKCVWKRPL